MDFEEMLAMLRTPPEEGLPDTIYDDMSTHYGDAVGGREGKIAELAAENAALQSEVTRLKVDIYDKLMSQGDEADAETENDDAGENAGDEDDTDDKGIESLFED